MHTAKHTTLICLQNAFRILSGFRTLVLLSSWSLRRAGLIFHPILCTAKKKGREDTRNTDTQLPQSAATQDLYEFFEISVHDVSDGDLSGLVQLSGPQADLLVGSQKSSCIT